MQRRVALLIPDMPDAEALLPWLRRIDEALWYTNFGPLARELEQKLAGRFAGNPVTGVSNCTLGLELCLWALGLAPGARVLVPALTFVATAAAVLRAGYRLVLSDVEGESWLLTPEIARRAAQSLPLDAVMPVAAFGCAQDAAAWDRFVADTGIPVVLDAAGAFGNQGVGSRFAAIFSLHATKTLGSGEGGFVVSPDRGLADAVRRLSNFGIDFENGLVPTSGTNAKLSEYHAAVALAALQRWPERSRLRIALHRRYLQVLSRACPRLRLQDRSPDGVYSILPVLLPEGASAAAAQAELAASGVETRRWYCPTLDRHPAFGRADRSGALDVAGILNERLLALPFHLSLREPDVEEVCTALARFLDRRR